MQFFVYCTDKAGAAGARRALLKQHWAFMRSYIERMIARGPTMSADGTAVTGSMHMVDLPDAAAARTFAHDDPLAAGGVFAEIMVRRFHNASGRTMWQFEGDPRNPRFLFIGEASPGPSATTAASEAQFRYFNEPTRASRVIVFGHLLDDDGAAWRGVALLLEAPDTAAAQALVDGDPAARLYARAQLHRWRFGGEENLQDLLSR